MPAFGGLQRLVNRSGDAVSATIIGGKIVFRNGEFVPGYGEQIRSGRFLRVGEPRGSVGVGAADVLVGTDAACALTGEGKVMCWGSGSYGQLGNGAMNGSATPVEVAGIRDAVAIGGGSYNFCALRRNGSLSCWGGNDDGQLGVGTSGRETNTGTPAAVRGLRGVASAGKAGDTMCVALRNGDGMCWGANDFGQTGHNDAETDDVTAPWDYLRTDAAVAAMGNLVEMGCGWNFCCGLHAQGGISCAGSTPLGGDSGFMGLSNVRSTTPVAAPSITFPVIAPAAE